MHTTDPTQTPTNTAQDTLTERYVHAATRRLGDDQRDDVALELRSDIADRVEALCASEPSLSTEKAEEAALIELGDPGRLAASYRGTLQHLVGPELFPTYVRVLRGILVAVVPLVTTIVALVAAFQGDDVGGVIGASISTALNTSVHIAFWTTLSFAILERSANPTQESLGLAPWTPDNLPALPTAPRGALGETVTNIVWLGLLAGFVVWQQVASPPWGDGERFPVLDPDLWSFWIPLILVALAAEAAFEIVKYRRGGVWTRGFATLNTVTGLVFAAPLMWLASQDQLLNPALTSLVQEQWSEFDPGVAHLVVLVSALAIWLWDTVDGWRKSTQLF
ncbi:permease prefix domain 1-containing protein [Nocardioides gilvus]|uniref:permease prefix domain 1-containing protein n=1 Tax=Nocardioides gilvus TaxID=1735589 RepID=UPI0013A569C9|nr:permease prefix domain 1-containing protein [Nocardioides gilvus]